MTSAIAFSTTRLPAVWAGDVERREERHAGADERAERARPAGQRDLLDDVADLHRDPQAHRVPLAAAAVGALPLAERPDRADGDEDPRPPVALDAVREGDGELRDRRQVAAELLEDADEDRDEERHEADEDDSAKVRTTPG